MMGEMMAARKGSAVDVEQRRVEADMAVGGTESYAHILKPYTGDIFGSRGKNEDGMIYLSRMTADPFKGEGRSSRAAGDIERAQAHGMDPAKHGRLPGFNNIDEASQVKTRRNYAKALCSLSWQGALTRERIVNKGAVGALATLSKCEDDETIEYCATAFRNLISESRLQKQICDAGGIQSMVTLVNKKRSKLRVKQDCMAGFCNLAFSGGGYEDTMVREHVITSLALHSTDSNRDTIRIAAISLLNVTCLPTAFSKTENVLDGIKMILEFLKQHTKAQPDLDGEINDILCMEALCNLAAHKEYQARIVEEGAIRLFSKLWQSTSKRIQYLTSVALACLSNAVSSRKIMVDQRVTGTLIALANQCPDPETRRHVLIALYRLSMAEESRSDMVKEGAVSTLIALADLPHPDSKAICTSALVNLSASADSRDLLLVQERVIIAVMKLAGERDDATQRNCAITLAHWLSVLSAHDKLIEAAVIDVLKTLSLGGDEITREMAATALYNLSCRSESVVAMSNFHADSALVDALTTVKSGESKKMCAAALGNLTKEVEGKPQQELNATTAIPVLINLLKFGEAKHASTAVFNLAIESGNCDIMLGEGVLTALNRLSLSESFEVRLQCAALLCRLSYHDQCRKNMMEGGLVKAVIALSKVNDHGTQHRCVSVLCNLACEGAMRPTLIAEGAEKALVSLSSSYNEAIRQGCAATMCNLACDEECQTALVKSKAVPALVILGLVASRSVTTEKFCAKALFNLLQSEEHLATILKQGAIRGISALPKCKDKETCALCAIAVCNMAAKKMAHSFLMAGGVLKAIMQLCRSKNLLTQRSCAKALLNLTIDSAHHDALFKAGIIATLALLASMGDYALSEVCITTLCMLTSHQPSRLQITSTDALKSIVNTAVMGDDECQEGRAVALYNLSWYPDSREDILHHGALGTIADILDFEDQDPATITICLQAVYNMSTVYKNLHYMIQQGVLKVIRYLLHNEEVNADSDDKHAFDPSDYMLQLCAHVLFNLSTDPRNHEQMVHDGATKMCWQLYHAEDEDNNEEDTEETAALAICNMACGMVNSAKMVADGADDVLIEFGKWGGEMFTRMKQHRTHRLIAASIRNLLCPPGNQEKMVNNGVLDTLIHICDSNVGDEEIETNCAKGLLIISSNKTLREIVAENEDAKAIISMSLDKGAPGVESEIDPNLLTEIEQESFKMGAQKTQKLGRAPPLPKCDIVTDLRLSEDNAPPLFIDIRELPWTRLDVEFKMEELDFPCTTLDCVPPIFTPEDDEYHLQEETVLYQKKPLPKDIYLLSERVFDIENDIIRPDAPVDNGEEESGEGEEGGVAKAMPGVDGGMDNSDSGERLTLPPILKTSQSGAVGAARKSGSKKSLGKSASSAVSMTTATTTTTTTTTTSSEEERQTAEVEKGKKGGKKAKPKRSSVGGS
jgi:hypothetical protein